LHMKSSTSSTGLKFENSISSTGFLLYSEDDMNFITANNTRMSILGNGNVGIGTTSPGAKLHVGASSLGGGGDASYTTMTVADIVNGSQLILRGLSPKLFYDQSGGGNAETYIDGAAYDIFSGTPAAPGSSYFHISDTTGNVGIGTDAPARTLHVNDYMRLEPISAAPSSPAAGDIYYDSDDNKLKCYNGTDWQDCF